MPRFSVLVPAYQAEATLASALRSVQDQTVEDWEAVIVDDGATDGTGALADGLAAEDARIRAVHRENGGLPAARNTALRASDAAYVSLLDADDLWLPDYLETLGGLLDARPEAGFAFGDAWSFRSGTDQVLRATTMRGIEAPATMPETAAEWFAALLERNFVFGLTTLRREALEAVGGWAEHLRAAEDWHLLLRLTARGWTGAFAGRPLCLYRSHPRQMSRELDRMLSARRDVLAEAAGWDLPPARQAEAQAALTRADAALARQAAGTYVPPVPPARRALKRAMGPLADLRRRRVRPPRPVRSAFPDLAAR